MERKSNPSKQMKESVKAYFYLTPALTVILVFFLGGFLLALTQSLGYFPAIGLEEMTLKYYQGVMKKPDFLVSLQFTLYIALVSTIISTIVGTYLAYYLLKSQIDDNFISIFLKFALIVPHLVAALMIVFLLSQGGIVSRLLIKTGLITDTGSFPALFYSKKAVGIIIIYCWKEIPFVTFMVYTVMKNIQIKLGEAAQTLNASQFQVFLHVILPLSMPSIISASAIIFAFSFGTFEIPYLLGASYPKTLPVLAYLNYISPELENRPLAMVMNIAVSIVCSLLILVYYLSMRKYLRKWG